MKSKSIKLIYQMNNTKINITDKPVMFIFIRLWQKEKKILKRKNN